MKYLNRMMAALFTAAMIIIMSPDLEAGNFFNFNAVPNIGEIVGNGNNMHQLADARRGGRSFGGRSRSRSSRSRSTRNKSMGGKRSNLKPTTPAKKPSFGGRRISPTQAKAKYGTPRKTQTIKAKNQAGNTTQYRVNNYGGFSSGLMMGYMTGQMTSMMWMGSLFYTRPAYVTNPNGMTSVYPPSFSWTRFFIFLIIIYVIYRIIKAIIRSRKNASSSGGGNEGSFG